MVFQAKTTTVEEFITFAQQAENENKLLELIHGEIIELSPGRTYYSGIGMILAHAVRSFCLENKLPCYISGADGTYTIVGQHVVAPDFAYKQTPLSKDYPDPEQPAWVVEVVSPTDKAAQVRNKRQIYMNAGILYWEIYAESRHVDVYNPGYEMQTVTINEMLDGGTVLPGFSLPTRELLSD